MAEQIPTQNDELIADMEVRAERDRTLQKMKWPPILNSISRTLALIGGSLFSFGMMGAFNIVSIAPDVTTLITTIGGGLSLASIGADYTASRISQSCSFDGAEVSAKSNAKHLVRELEAHNMVIACKEQVKEEGFENPGRRDGKSWVAATQVEQTTAGISIS